MEHVHVQNRLSVTENHFHWKNFGNHKQVNKSYSLKFLRIVNSQLLDQHQSFCQHQLHQGLGDKRHGLQLIVLLLVCCWVMFWVEQILYEFVFSRLKERSEKKSQLRNNFTISLNKLKNIDVVLLRVSQSWSNFLKYCYALKS